ncbi:MAG: TetR/AcrR family transcriptional regulator [Lachnospiraceae bacterium]|nr:TetR/AcrR family transcriptional regulator [Lachnospiraceae bacterium]
MGRRKKEPQNVHRKNISKIAEQLFYEKGIENTSMNDIAKEAGYSKATLYVYFKNKEELIGILVLESMQKLHDYIKLALEESNDTKERYKKICYGLVKYQEEYPFYFKLVLENINIDFETTHFLPEEKETFLIGEQINDLLIDFLKQGMECGEIRSDIEVLPAIFSFWGMLSGLIQIATNKELYVGQRMGKSKMEFLNYGFDMIYDSIIVNGKREKHF